MDVAFTGHMGGAAYLAAIALGSNLFNMLYWPLGFLRMSTSGIAAQSFGADDSREVRLSLLRPLCLSLILGLLIILFQDPIFSIYEWATASKTDVQTIGFARQYFSILVWGAPAMLAGYAFAGWFIGLGEAKKAMWTAIAINVCNFTASFILVVGFSMKISGVAIGTLVAQWVGLIIAMILAVKPFGGLKASLEGFMAHRQWAKIWVVNRDLFLRTICLAAVTLWFTREGARQGDVMLGANALLMQMFIFFSYFSDGLAYAAESLVGRCIGAKDDEGFRLTIRRVIKWGGVLAVIFSVLYFAAGEWILGLLTDNQDTVASASQYIPWIVIVPIVSFGAFAYDGVMVGATASRDMLGSVGIGALLFFVCYYSGTALGLTANSSLWTAFIVYLLARSLYGVIWTMRLKPVR